MLLQVMLNAQHYLKDALRYPIEKTGKRRMSVPKSSKRAGKSKRRKK